MTAIKLILAITHLDGIEVPRRKWGAPCPLLCNYHTLLMFYFPSPSPKEGTRYQQWSLRASQTLSLFLERVTWDSWRVTWFWSDEAARRWLFINLPFVSTTPNKCLPTAAAITTFSGESRTCSFTFQWHSNSLFINVLCKTTEKWFSSQGKDKPFWGLFQPRERYAQADTKNK